MNSKNEWVELKPWRKHSATRARIANYLTRFIRPVSAVLQIKLHIEGSTDQSAAVSLDESVERTKQYAPRPYEQEEQ